MPGLISFARQSCAPKPQYLENDIPDLHDKVYIVTGANAGVGKETAQMLYSKNAKVYLAARSEPKARKAIDEIMTVVPKSTGELIFLQLDLADLTTIKASAEEFLSKENRLHVLFNNAGVGHPPAGSKTAQGYELQLGVNCVGAFLFTKLLTPVLVSTAKAEPRNSVRVIWASSSAAEGVHVDGIIDNLDYHVDRSTYDKYCISKLGNYLHATEFAAQYKADGVVSIPLNPGNLDSEFWRHSPKAVSTILRHTLLYPPVYGAYTTIFAAFSPEVTVEKSGTFVAPWGRFWDVSKELVDASKTKAQGGSGIAKQFWEWSEAQVRPFL
ncbi:NAD(P)-binding protein [Thozetella sp. PMI_491]|nr:NAD(P)-binding protein [Thozetella sp. PMI_491]